MPEKELNLEAGVFMVNLTFYSTNHRFLATSARPVSLWGSFTEGWMTLYPPFRPLFASSRLYFAPSALSSLHFPCCLGCGSRSRRLSSHSLSSTMSHMGTVHCQQGSSWRPTECISTPPHSQLMQTSRDSRKSSFISFLHYTLSLSLPPLSPSLSPSPLSLPSLPPLSPSPLSLHLLQLLPVPVAALHDHYCGDQHPHHSLHLHSAHLDEGRHQ